MRSEAVTRAPWSERLKVRIMMRVAIAMAFLSLSGLPLAAQDTDLDPYSNGRAIITDASRIVTPQGVEETFFRRWMACTWLIAPLAPGGALALTGSARLDFGGPVGATKVYHLYEL